MLHFYMPRIYFLCRGQRNKGEEGYERYSHVTSPSSIRHCCSRVSKTFIYHVKIILTKNHWAFVHKYFLKYPPNSLVHFIQNGGGEKKDILFWLFSPISKFCSTYSPYNIYQMRTTFQAPNHKAHPFTNRHHNFPVICQWVASVCISFIISIN